MIDKPVVAALKLAEATVAKALELPPSKCCAALSLMRLHIPYFWDGYKHSILCGREYGPMGCVNHGSGWVREDYPHLVADRSLVEGIPGMKDGRWFFHDGNAPWWRKEFAERYRLLILANIDSLNASIDPPKPIIDVTPKIDTGRDDAAFWADIFSRS